MAFPFTPSRSHTATPPPAGAYGGHSTHIAPAAHDLTTHQFTTTEFSTSQRSSLRTPDIPDYEFPPPLSPHMGYHAAQTTPATGYSGQRTARADAAPTATHPTPLPTSRKEALKSWTDLVAGQIKLTNVQLAELHFLVDLGKNMDPGQLQMQLWQIAYQYSLSNTLESMKTETAKLVAVVEDLKTLSDTTFKLTNDQGNYILRVAKDMAFDPKRTMWMSMNDELEQRLKDVDGFSNIFSNEWREKVLREECKDRASSARTQYRGAIFESIVGPERTTLEQTTYKIAQKLRRGGAGGSLDVGYQIQVALLRRFTNENMSDYFIVHTVDANGVRQVTKKRKASGKVPKGEDYWSKVDLWFAAKIARWGPEIKAKQWQDYIQETLRLDVELYKRGPGDLMEPQPIMSGEESMVDLDNRSVPRTSRVLAEPVVGRNALSVEIE